MNNFLNTEYINKLIRGHRSKVICRISHKHCFYYGTTSKVTKPLLIAQSSRPGILILAKNIIFCLMHYSQLKFLKNYGIIIVLLPCFWKKILVIENNNISDFMCSLCSKGNLTSEISLKHNIAPQPNA